MRVFIAVLVLIFSFQSLSKADDKFNYSVFYERDSKAVMFIYYESDQVFGQIIQFGGYKWFRLTYSNKDSETSSFIQPSKYGVDGEMDTWMIERFAIDKMEYDFREIEQDQYLTFLSPQATQEMIGYLSRDESFSISTLSNNAWYAGTFIPIKSIKDFEKLAELNPKTFCKTIGYDYIQTQIFQDLNISTENLIEELNYANLRCDDNFNLK